MRLWHLMLAVVFVSVALEMTREPVTRVVLIVFLTGVGEVVCGIFSTCALIETVAAIGAAEGLRDHAGAALATLGVLAVATLVMSAWLFAGFWAVSVAV